MDKKAIQEERMRNYFLEATMDLIRAEGISVVSARNVADRAGYSYATLYNYFSDIRDLIFSCAEYFMRECRELVMEQVKGISPEKKLIQAIAIQYTKYFVQYPGVFELLYQQKLSDMATGSSNVKSIYLFFDSLIESAQSKQEKKLENYKLALHGLLLFYFNGRSGLDYSQLQEEIKRIAELI